MKSAGPSLSAFQLVVVCVLGLSCVAALVIGSRHLEAKSITGAAPVVQAASFEPRAFAGSADGEPAADGEPTAAVQAFAPPAISEPRPAAKAVRPLAAVDPEPIEPETAAPEPQTRRRQKRARSRSRDRSADRPAVVTAQAGTGATRRRQRVQLVLSKRDSAGVICVRLKAGGGRCTQKL